MSKFNSSLHQFPDGPRQQKRDAVLKLLSQGDGYTDLRDVEPDSNAPYGSREFNKWLFGYDTVHEV
jgi:hypothetical protein